MIDTASLKQIVDSSAQLSAWGLGVLGGSVAAIVSTSYRRPDLLKFRLAYLLFLPGWATLAYSLFQGNALVGNYLAALLGDPSKDNLLRIGSEINNAYAEQRSYLLFSLCCFGCWLVTYLLQWVFLAQLQTPSDKK